LIPFQLGRHFYGVTVSNEKKENFITGIKEIKDIKATTYADYTLSIMKNVSNNLQQLTHWAAHQCAYQIHLKWI
jgi:hypothetical protein